MLQKKDCGFDPVLSPFVIFGSKSTMLAPGTAPAPSSSGENLPSPLLERRNVTKVPPPSRVPFARFVHHRYRDCDCTKASGARYEDCCAVQSFKPKFRCDTSKGYEFYDCTTAGAVAPTPFLIVTPVQKKKFEID